MNELLKSILSNRELGLGILECGGDRVALVKLTEAAGISLEEEQLRQLAEFTAAWKKQQAGEVLTEAEAALLSEELAQAGLGKLSLEQLQKVTGGQQKEFYEDPSAYEEDDEAGLQALPAILAAVAIRQAAKAAGKAIASATTIATQAVAAQR